MGLSSSLVYSCPQSNQKDNKMKIEHIKGPLSTLGAPTVQWVQKVGVKPHQFYGGTDASYEGKPLAALPWESEQTINTMKEGLEQALSTPASEVTFDHCLTELYVNETIHKDPHCDSGDLVVTVSLGAPRELVIQNNDTGSVRSISLNHGDVVVFDKESQQRTTRSILQGLEKGPYINLTYRTKE